MIKIEDFLLMYLPCLQDISLLKYVKFLLLVFMKVSSSHLCEKLKYSVIRLRDSVDEN